MKLDRNSLTLGDLRRWLFEHFEEHLRDDAVCVTTLATALAAELGGTPNNKLRNIVVDFCLDLQQATQDAQDSITPQ